MSEKILFSWFVVLFFLHFLHFSFWFAAFCCLFFTLFYFFFLNFSELIFAWNDDEYDYEYEYDYDYVAMHAYSCSVLNFKTFWCFLFGFGEMAVARLWDTWLHPWITVFFSHLSSWVELKNLLIPNSLGSRPRPFLTDFEFSRLTTCWIRSPQILSFSAYKTSIHFHTFPKCLMCVLDHRFLPVPWFQCLCPSLSTFYWIWVHVWPYDAFFLNHLMNGFNYVILNSVGKNNFPPGPLFALELEWWARKCCYLPGFYFFGTFAFHQATKEIYGFHLAEGYLDNLSYWC